MKIKIVVEVLNAVGELCVILFNFFYKISGAEEHNCFPTRVS